MSLRQAVAAYKKNERKRQLRAQRREFLKFQSSLAATEKCSSMSETTSISTTSTPNIPTNAPPTTVECSSTKKNNELTETNSVSVSTTNNNSDQNVNQSITISNNKENSVTDSCFKGENLQQLSTNALPPYVPNSPTNLKIAESSNYEFHCCTDCGDTFALKSSLTFHLERRSVLIKFPCDACKSHQIFYNRCTLLSHIRSHTDKSETADIAKAVVNPLPRVFMDGLQNEFVNGLDEELSSIEDTDVMPPTDILEFSLKEVDNGITSQGNSADEGNPNIVKVKCLDCNEEFNNSKERAQHLTQNDNMSAIINQCNKCSMICPSKCFLKAHQRIHLQISPYVCPECGESPSPLWINFQYHVKFQCFHNARTVGYKCPVCKRLSPNKDSLLKHMELHTEKYAKCEGCPRAYMNVPAFTAHINVHHSDLPTAPTFHMIYKCSLCDIVFLNQEQMLSHRSTHLKEQICEYVFSCMQCGKPLEDKNKLYDHIKCSHPKIFKHILENSEPRNPQSETVNSYRGKVECILCNSMFHSHQGYLVHLSKAHINHNQPCTYCYMVLNNRKEMIIHGKKHLNKGSFLCLLCNNKRWNDEKQLNSHLVKHVEKMQHCTFCPICDEILKTPPEMINHLQEEHMLFERMGTITRTKNSQMLKEIVTCHFCRDSFADDDELQDHLKTKHQVECLKRSNSIANAVNGSESLSKKVRVEGNVCSKCNYHSVEREDFKKHILTHKTHKSTSQCQDCGLCFVVESALEKHLRIVHKVSDTKKYIEKEGTNYMPDVENHTEVSTCNSLICGVCFTTFPNETSLKTHTRSHGMAFIQAAKSTSSLS